MSKLIAVSISIVLLVLIVGIIYYGNKEIPTISSNDTVRPDIGPQDIPIFNPNQFIITFFPGTSKTVVNGWAETNDYTLIDQLMDDDRGGPIIWLVYSPEDRWPKKEGRVQRVDRNWFLYSHSEL